MAEKKSQKQHLKQHFRKIYEHLFVPFNKNEYFLTTLNKQHELDRFSWCEMNEIQRVNDAYHVGF